MTGSEIENLDESIKVYNLEVEDYHTYFVGDVPVLVHNYDNDTTPFEEPFNAADNYQLSDDTFNNHILDRHGPNSSYSGKSHFNSNFNIRDGIDSTLTGDNSILKPNTNNRDGWIFEQTFSYSIGEDPRGRSLYTLKVVIDPLGNVVTAFPKR